MGKAMAKKFAAEGFRVLLCARNKEQVDALAAELGNGSKGYVCDMADKEAVIAWGKQLLLDADGRIDVLINNAGTFLPGQVSNEADGVFEKMWHLNVAGPYHLTRAVLPAIKVGHIFNICSTASFVAYTDGGSYCISKFAMLGFSKVLRAELKNSDIRVTSVMPGATLTDSWNGTDLPSTRFMKPSDVASAVWGCYALSPHTVVEELLLRPQQGDIAG